MPEIKFSTTVFCNQLVVINSCMVGVMFVLAQSLRQRNVPIGAAMSRRAGLQERGGDRKAYRYFSKNCYVLSSGR